MTWPTTDARFLDATDRKACDAIIREGSKSFYAASLLLPPEPRSAARALYAFCRFSDDLIDDNHGGRAARLAERIDKVYRGTPVDHIADRAFATVVESYAIPRAIPDALIEGFAWDEAGRRYRTIDGVIAYSARVAATVGVMMTLIMNRRDHESLSRAADLGLAMQLTNIARDVGEDARMGRIYLPLDWLVEAGIDPDALIARPRYSPALGRVVARLLKEADRYYARAARGIDALPWACRPAIRSAASIYRAIGGRIAAHDYDSVSRRAVVGKDRKLGMMTNAVFTPSRAPRTAFEPTHAAARFLVEASVNTAPAAAAAATAGGIERFIELLEAVERRERELYPLAAG